MYDSCLRLKIPFGGLVLNLVLLSYDVLSVG